MKEQFWFLHLPKCGGSSLLRMIDDQYGRQRVLHVYGGRFAERVIRKHPLILRWRYSAVVGHLSWGIHHGLPVTPRFVTILREPVDRVASLYHYIRADPSHHSYSHARGSLEEFASADIPQTTNQQTQRLGGPGTGQAAKDQDKALAAEAIKHLETFEVVGVLDRVQETVNEIGRRFGWKPMTLPHINKSERTAISSEAEAIIRDRNQLDLRLYEWAQNQSP